MTYLRMGAAVAATMLLVGCSSGSDSPETSAATSADATTSAPPAADAPTRGLPPGVDENTAATAGAGLSPDGKLWIVTYGSSTNPLVATGVSADGQTVTVTLAQRDAPATMDLVATTSTVALPTGVDVKETVTVVLGKLGSVKLGGKPAPAGVVWLPAQ